MPTLWGYLTTLSLLLFSSTSVHGAAEPSPMIISYVPHSAVENIYKPLIEQAYNELNIPVRFEKVSDDRSLRLLENNVTDADVVRIETVLSDYPNIIAVEPALGRVDFVLYCRPDVPCDPQKLTSGALIGLVGATSYFDNVLSLDALMVIRLNNYAQLAALFNAGRLDYAVDVIDSFEGGKAVITREHKSAILFSAEGFHLLHKRHKQLAQRLSPVLARLLSKLNPHS